MAKGDSNGGEKGRASGNDAALMKPRLMPDDALLPRDDSGGPEWQPYTMEWGDGGFTTGDKAHLSVRGGEKLPKSGSEQVSTVDRRNKGRGGKDLPMRSDED